MKDGRFDISGDSARGKREKRISWAKTGLIVVLLIAVIVLSVKLATNDANEDHSDDPGDGGGRPLPPNAVARDRKGRPVCDNEQCVNAAGNLFKSMNLKV